MGHSVGGEVSRGYIRAPLLVESLRPVANAVAEHYLKTAGFGMHQDERGYLIVPHEVATGDDCDGCLIVVEHGDVADLKCNSCGAVVDTVPIDRARVRLIELGSDEICSEWCPHCGSLNTFPGFSAIEAFICRECGEGVDVEPPVQ